MSSRITDVSRFRYELLTIIFFFFFSFLSRTSSLTTSEEKIYRIYSICTSIYWKEEDPKDEERRGGRDDLVIEPSVPISNFGQTRIEDIYIYIYNKSDPRTGQFRKSTKYRRSFNILAVFQKFLLPPFPPSFASFKSRFSNQFAGTATLTGNVRYKSRVIRNNASLRNVIVPGG